MAGRVAAKKRNLDSRLSIATKKKLDSEEAAQLSVPE
jgi:hypothetical protein